MTTGRQIRLGKSFRLDKNGKPARSEAHLDVSARLRRKASKRVKVARRSPK
jgi:hypothetical protein